MKTQPFQVRYQTNNNVSAVYTINLHDFFCDIITHGTLQYIFVFAVIWTEMIRWNEIISIIRMWVLTKCWRCFGVYRLQLFFFLFFSSALCKKKCFGRKFVQKYPVLWKKMFKMEHEFILWEQNAEGNGQGWRQVTHSYIKENAFQTYFNFRHFWSWSHGLAMKQVIGNVRVV